MAKQRKRRRRRNETAPSGSGSAPGAPPGTLAPPDGSAASEIDVIAYGPTLLREETRVAAGEVDAVGRDAAVTWVDVTGVGSVDALKQVAAHFDLHPLALEDAVNRNQRPKVETYGDTIFVVLNWPTFDPASGHLGFDQLSLFVGRGFVVTMQERSAECLAAVRGRLRAGRGRIRSSGADYLAYALIDAVVDSFFPAVERLADRIDDLEEAVMAGADVAAELHGVRHDLQALRRVLWPTREAIKLLLRGESAAIVPATLIFLRDCADHAAQLVDLVDASRDAAASLMDLQIAQASNRMNEVMKVLTLIATIFIPLGFIAGVYGMNFERQSSPLNMPELGWYWGYPFALSLMGVTALGLLFYFFRKGWLGSKRR